MKYRTQPSARALAFPRAFSIMASIATGKVVDILRVIGSTKTYRASAADVTRKLLDKGMAVEAAEYALSYATGRPVELTTSLLADVHAAMGEEFVNGLPGREPADILTAVLSRMWPEVVQACERVDVRTKVGSAKHRKLLAGPPLTAHGRAQTIAEIRAQALADVVSGQAEAPKLVPPRTVQEAHAQARLENAADRVAMDRGVSATELLARTPGGRLAGIPVPDESAPVKGYAPDHEAAKGPRTGPGTRMGAGEAEMPSAGEMLAQIRKGRKS